MNCSNVTELLPAYTLDALEPAERAPVEQHLAVCGACRAELAAYREVAGALPHAARTYQPPARLKSAILAEVKAPARPGAAGSFWRSPAWTAAGLVIILALVISNLLLWRQIRSNPAGGSEFRMVTLTGTQAAPQASGLLVISESGQFGALIVDGLAPLPAEKQYQVWLIHNGQRTSGGVFSVQNDGYSVLRVQSPEPLSRYEAFGITIEPAGGSPGPTGEKVLGST